MAKSTSLTLDEGRTSNIVKISDFRCFETGGTSISNFLGETGEQILASDLVRVKTPAGGGTLWNISGPSGMESLKEIQGILCYYQKCGILWPAFDPTANSLPVLRTWDLITAEQIGPIPPDMVETLEACRIDARHFSWSKCGYNQWGTGKNGVGKRCREQRMMFILTHNSQFPIMVTIQPGSLKTITKFINSLCLQSQIPHYYQAVISLSLESVVNRGGQPFSRIVPKLIGQLSDEDGEVVKKKWTDPLSKVVMNIGLDEPDENDASDVETPF